MVASAGVAGSLFAAPRIVVSPGEPGDPDGTLVLRSADPLRKHPATVLHVLRAWADVDPGYPLVAERAPDGGWRSCSYGEAAAAAEAIGQALLDRGLGPGRPLLVLSGNSVSHLLVTLGAMTAGVPVAPVSVAYSVQSRDHARIRAITELTGPGAVFAEDGDRFAAALDAAGAVPAIVAAGGPAGADRLADLLATAPGPAVAAAFAALGPDSIAKILFTSGSTGTPKGVLNTHRMLAANQQMIFQVWPFLDGERPVIVDWLPWSHTFGGNHNVNMMITAGGTVYVDAGRPAAGLFAQTIENLADVPPTVYFNVPAGYAQLVPALEADPAFAARFFSRLRLMFNAAAALPAGLRDPAGRRGPAGHGPADPGHRVLGRHRDRARGDGGALRLHRRPVHRGAAARRRGEAGPGRGRLRDPGPRADGHAGLPRPARPHRAGLRRRRVLPLRRRGRAGRPGQPRRRPGLPGPDRRGLQAHHRHVRAGGRGARGAAVRRAGPGRRGDHGRESRPGGCPGLAEPCGGQPGPGCAAVAGRRADQPPGPGRAAGRGAGRAQRRRSAPRPGSSGC